MHHSRSDSDPATPAAFALAPVIVLLIALAIATSVALLVPGAAGAARAGPAVAASAANGGSAEPLAPSRGARRCYRRAIVIRKTSIGIHQWTAGQRTAWCSDLVGGHRQIITVERRSWAETGTNWELIGRDGDVRRIATNRALASTRFHFRLAYPWLVQNCRPRLTLAIFADGRSLGTKSIGC